MFEAVFVIDKPVGPTSFDIVRQVKEIYPGAKVGHSGSLDPFATGALVVLTGKATKLSDFLLTADKRYIAKAKLGEATDTMDRTGQVTKTIAVPELTEDQVRATLKAFEGEWMQTPPMYSAKKIHGVRLYELARNQIHVRRQPIPVQLYEMKFLSMELPHLEFEVWCSKGTYIRSLADELGEKLGTAAHLSELRRLGCGQFGLSNSVTLEQLRAEPEKWKKWGFDNYVSLVRSIAANKKGGQTHSPSFANAGQEW